MSAMTTHDQPPEPLPDHRPGPARDRATGRHLRSVPRGEPTGERRPTRLALRDERDLLALIPYTFGFHPERSLVMMLLGRGGQPMFARVDLPTSAEEADAACAELVRAAVTNGGRRAVLVAYTDDETAAYLATDHAAEALTASGFDVVLGLRAGDGRWWRTLPELETHEGVAYDLSTHPITASGVLEGRVTHRSRRELAESLVPSDPDRVDAVADAHAELRPLPEDECGLRAEARWLETWVGERTGEAGELRDVPPADLARVVRALSDVQLRDVAWASMTRSQADAHVRLWTHVVVQCPLELLAPAAGLLAFAAWLSGHGALAWCAVERSLQSDPDHSLARLVAQALDGAMPPSTWEPLDRRSLRLLSG